jgi:hypothetical protein
MSARRFEQREELEFLRRWRAEAKAVIEEWDRVWEELGCPGSLGQTKAQGVLSKFKEMKNQ